MDVTQIINKLHQDYENPQNRINGSIKYEFSHHGCLTRIFYTQENGLQHQIILVITCEQVDYLTTIYFSPNNNTYELKRYIPNEVYLALFNAIFKKDDKSTKPYFDHMFNTILNTQPIVCNYKKEIQDLSLYQYRNAEDNPDTPFFETVIRKKMSPEMKKKIHEKFEWKVADQIIKYCIKSNITLRFTADISRSSDIFEKIPDLLN